MKRYKKNIAMTIFLFILAIGTIAISIVISNKPRLEEETTAQSAPVLKFLSNGSSTISVLPYQQFSVDLRLNTQGQKVIAIDIYLKNNSNLDLLSISPNTANFKTAVPIDGNGNFNSSIALSQRYFGLLAYNYSSDTLSDFVNQSDISIATLIFKAKGTANVQDIIGINYTINSSNESNVIYFNSNNSPVDLLTASTASDLKVNITGTAITSISISSTTTTNQETSINSSTSTSSYSTYSAGYSNNYSFGQTTTQKSQNKSSSGMSQIFYSNTSENTSKKICRTTDQIETYDLSKDDRKVIDINDFIEFLKEYGQYNNCNLKADFNCDCKVDYENDFRLLLNYFGKKY